MRRNQRVLRQELFLRDQVEQTYAEARRLVFDVIEGPPNQADLSGRQLAALEAFHTAEAELHAFRYEHPALPEGRTG